MSRHPLLETVAEVLLVASLSVGLLVAVVLS